MLAEFKNLPLSKSASVVAAITLLVILIIGGCSTINRSDKQSKIERPCTTQLECIGQKIYQNETGGDVKHLIFWSPNEDFASLGVGHFIWYPQNKRLGFKETFPDLIRYLKANGADVPVWLSQQIQTGSLWSSREQLEQSRESRQFLSLQQLLLDTTDLQVSFLFERLENALPEMLKAADPGNHNRITQRFNTMKASPNGLYPLVDYVNFKGEGTALSERYDGLGWGLLQVLETMQAVPAGPQALKEFSRAADFVLTRRVDNSPVEKNEARWLEGWRVRVNTYAEGTAIAR